MGKKKILIFIDWYLPGFRAGGPIRSCANLVAHLSDEFEFLIITSDVDYLSLSSYKTVNKNEWNRLPDGSSVYYIANEKLNSTVIKKLIKETETDYYYLNGIFSKLFTIVPLRYISDKKNVIIASRGMLASSALAIKSLKKKLFLFFAKKTELFNGVTFQASSQEEMNQILLFFPQAKIIVAPNLPRKMVLSKPNTRKKQFGELRLLNIARISPEKNLLFALEVLKHVKGNVSFDYYGSIYDHLYADKCNKALKGLPENIKAEYKGEANSEMLFQSMTDYHFLFMPSRGENFGHIILESMSEGLPVIISDQTPWNNLELKNAGWEISLRNTSGFVTVIEKCVEMNASEYDACSNAAFKYAAQIVMDKEKIQANRRLFS